MCDRKLDWALFWKWFLKKNFFPIICTPLDTPQNRKGKCWFEIRIDWANRTYKWCLWLHEKCKQVINTETRIFIIVYEPRINIFVPWCNQEFVCQSMLFIFCCFLKISIKYLVEIYRDNLTNIAKVIKGVISSAPRGIIWLLKWLQRDLHIYSRVSFSSWQALSSWHDSKQFVFLILMLIVFLPGLFFHVFININIKQNTIWT